MTGPAWMEAAAVDWIRYQLRDGIGMVESWMGDDGSPLARGSDGVVYLWCGGWTETRETTSE